MHEACVVSLLLLPAAVQSFLQVIALIIKKTCDLFVSFISFPTKSPHVFRLSLQVTTPSFGPVKTYELLHHMTGKGLSAKYHFPRQPCLYEPSMVAVQVILTNGSDHTLEQIHIDRNPASLNIHCFNTIGEYTCKSLHCPSR